MIKMRSVEVISTPVGAGQVAFEKMSGGESLGRPFEYDVDLLSPRGDLPIADAVGKPMTIELAMDGAAPRFFNGVIARFSLVAWTGEKFRYRAKLRPWFWLLTQTLNSRIYSSKGDTVVDVVTKVLKDHGDLDARGLNGVVFAAMPYVVQYQESDFNFVSRLLEQAGVYYWFRHARDRHTMVLAEGISTEKIGADATIPFFAGNDSAIDRHGHQHIGSWGLGQQVQPGAFVAKEFDFENPGAPLLSARSAPKPGSPTTLEVFEYPGVHVASGDRDAYVGRRLQEQQQDGEVATGAGNARGIRAGACFKLSGYPADDQNRDYLVTSASFDLTASDDSSGGQDTGADYRCHFTAIDSRRIFRPPLSTPRPRVAGLQTAIVVGQGGEEIWTDRYGRVKIRFPWDRGASDQKTDEERSCWVRVSQTWAGPKWGSIHIPRVGQEVIVDFLEGDPDRPIIVGRVYNGANMPPYELPANRTQSGIKSRSAPGGAPTNFNELRFEDKQGSEQVSLQAERDLRSLVKNDERREIGHDRTTEIANDETITVDGNRTETVKKDQTLTIKGNRTETVGRNETVTITGHRMLNIALGETVAIAAQQTIAVGANRSLVVGKDQALTVAGAQSVDVGKDQTVTVSGGRTLSITRDDTVSVQGKRAVTIGKDESLRVGKKLTLQAGEEIQLTTGKSSITMKKSGEIVIKGKDITLESLGKINVKASGDVIVKGSKIKQQG